MKAGRRTNAPRFRGAGPDQVLVEGSSYFWYKLLMSFDPWYVTNPRAIRKRM